MDLRVQVAFNAMWVAEKATRTFFSGLSAFIYPLLVLWPLLLLHYYVLDSHCKKKMIIKTGKKKCYLPFNDWIERLSRDVSLNRCSLFIFFYMECSNHLIGLIKFKIQYVSYPKLMRIINFDNSFWLLIFKIVNNSRTGHRWDCSTPNTSLYI